MKIIKSLSLVMAVLMTASCASTGDPQPVAGAYSGAETGTPVGRWDYVIAGTPQGDMFGVMTITSGSGTYAASLSTPAGEVVIEQFRWDDAARKVAGTFNYTGFSVMLDAALAGRDMSGAMYVEGMRFTFKATRKV